MYMECTLIDDVQNRASCFFAACLLMLWTTILPEHGMDFASFESKIDFVWGNARNSGNYFVISLCIAFNVMHLG